MNFLANVIATVEGAGEQANKPVRLEHYHIQPAGCLLALFRFPVQIPESRLGVVIP